MTESIIAAEPHPPLPPTWPIFARVNLGGEQALVPDLERMADILRQLLP